jgi:hypothetical protein
MALGEAGDAAPGGPSDWPKADATLPFSGRQGGCGDEAESRWRPDHSKGLFGE